MQLDLHPVPGALWQRYGEQVVDEADVQTPVPSQERAEMAMPPLHEAVPQLVLELGGAAQAVVTVPSHCA